MNPGPGHDRPHRRRAALFLVDYNAAAIDLERGVARFLPAAVARGAAEEAERRQQRGELGGQQLQRPRRHCQGEGDVGRLERERPLRLRGAGAAAARPVPLPLGQVPESHDEPRVSRGERAHAAAAATAALGRDK